jgi:hypothetical protein
MGVGGQRQGSAVVLARKSPDTQCTVGWVGHATGLVGCRKSAPPPGLEPRIRQPLASRYTN